jgi:hypothetical protein
VGAVSNSRKLRQGNGGRLTRDRAEWTRKTRLGSGSSAFRPAASRNRAAERNRLNSLSARSLSNGVQAARGGLSVRLYPGLPESPKQAPERGEQTGQEKGEQHPADAETAHTGEAALRGDEDTGSAGARRRR